MRLAPALVYIIVIIQNPAWSFQNSHAQTYIFYSTRLFKWRLQNEIYFLK